VVVLAEEFVVHPVRGGVDDRTANARESILRRTGCSTLAVNWAKNGLDPSLCLHVFPANRKNIESQRADSNRCPCSSYEFAVMGSVQYLDVRKSLHKRPFRHVGRSELLTLAQAKYSL
jgi:hypothetical protein